MCIPAALAAFRVRDFASDDPIALSAIVGLEDVDGIETLYFLVPAAGGETLDCNGTSGNGFTFGDYTPEALVEALRKAAAFFTDSKTVDKVRMRIMAEDHSWKKSAKEYLDMYGRAKGRTGMRLTTP